MPKSDLRCRPALPPNCDTRRGLLLSGGFPPLLAAHAALPAPARSALALFHGPVTAHDLLLARAAVLLHHGGSGTAAAALAAGTPQVVAPLQFDQPFWAGRLEAMGVAPPPFEWGALLPAAGGSGSGSSSGSRSSECKERGAGRGSTDAAAGIGVTEQVEHAAAAALAARLQQAAAPEVRRSCQEAAEVLKVGTAPGSLLHSLAVSSLCLIVGMRTCGTVSHLLLCLATAQAPEEAGIETAAALIRQLLGVTRDTTTCATAPTWGDR
jgi:hypothetical protein